MQRKMKMSGTRALLGHAKRVLSAPKKLAAGVDAVDLAVLDNAGTLPRFFSNITRTVSASSLQFVITLFTTPIMTRLYEPVAYATFGIVNTMAAVMMGIGLLSLPNAYCAEKSEAVSREIMQTMVVLLIGLTGLAIVVAAVLAVVGVHRNGMDIEKIGLVMLPVLVLTSGARQLMMNVAIRYGKFKRLSVGQIIEPVCSRSGSIALGAVAGGHPLYILASLAFGHISTMVVLLPLLPKKIHGHWRHVVAHLPHFIASLRRQGDFVLFGTISQQTQQVVMLGIQLAIATYFSGDLAGQYILAISILNMPLVLIAMSTAPVVYHHFIQTEKTDPMSLPRHFLMTSGLYLLAGLCIYALIFFFGEEIFRIAFGATWTHAGHIASTLSMAYVGMFILTGVQSILTVTRRMRLQFTLEIGTSIPLLFLAIFCFRTISFDRTIFYLALIWLLRSIVLLAAALIAAFQHRTRLEANA